MVYSWRVNTEQIKKEIVVPSNCRGQTALHKAAQYKRRSICCMLVAGGATLSVKDRQGNTPRDLALQAEDRDLAAYLYSESVHTFLFFLQRFIMKNSPFD